MSIWSRFITFIVERFWPWFKEFIWPVIKEHIIDIMKFVINFYKNRIMEWFRQDSETRENSAKEKAEDADKKADQATNEEEIQRFRAEAKVWREVAEQFRQQNEELKQKIVEFETEANAISENMINEIDFEVDFSKHNPRISIGKEERKVPPLNF